MQERLKQILQSIKDLNQKLAKKTKMYIVAGVLLVVFVALGAVIFLNNTPYSTLFTGLTEQETTEVMGKLQEMQIETKTSPGGTILVPKDAEHSVRAKLVSEGYPKSGFTYDIVTSNIGLMSTDSEKEYFRVADLQERIAATIRMFDNVKDAKVIIALGKEKKYVLEKDRVENTASVTVMMKDGGSPTPEQVKGIQNLTSRSIPGVSIDKIAIIDGNGRDVSATENIQVSATALKMDIERQYDDTMRAKILHVLTPLYGEEKLRVAVTNSVDIDKKIKELINYLPTQDNKGVISKEQTNSEKVTDNGANGGVAGSESNADVPTYPGVASDGNNIIFQDDKSYDYLVSQVKEQIQTDAATLLNTSIGITLDGIDLTQQKLDDLKRLVATAAGINVLDATTKIEVFSSPFAQPAPPEALPWIFDSKFIPYVVAAGGVLLIGVILGIIGIVSLNKKRRLIAELEDAKLETKDVSQMSEEELEALRIRNLQNLEEFKLGATKVTTREDELQAEITAFASENPEIAAGLLKTLLRGGEAVESE